MAITVPLRHELKFYINPVEYQVLSRQLDRVLERDPNGTKTTSITSVPCTLTPSTTTPCWTSWTA